MKNVYKECGRRELNPRRQLGGLIPNAFFFESASVEIIPLDHGRILNKILAKVVNKKVGLPRFELGSTALWKHVFCVVAPSCQDASPETFCKAESFDRLPHSPMGSLL